MLRCVYSLFGMKLSTRHIPLIVILALLLQTWWVIIWMAQAMNLGEVDVWKVATDVGQYYSKVKPVITGHLAFNVMPLEYPIAAFPLMALPAFFAPTMDDYLVPFVLEMLMWNALCFYLVVRWVRIRSTPRAVVHAAVWYTAWMMLFTPTWALRIDVPAATIIFASYTWLVTQPWLAAVLGVFGGYMKLVPLLLSVVAARRHWNFRAAIVGAVSFSFILCLWWVAAQPSMEYAIRYHLNRGIEIGSLYAGIFYGLGQLFHWPMWTGMRFASIELFSPVPSLVIHLLPVVQLTAITWPLFRLRLDTDHQNLRVVIAMVLAYIIFGKVLSPQYLLWLVPLYAVLEGRGATKQKIFFSVAVGLTAILYPVRFLSLVQLKPVMMIILNVRNGLLVWLYWQMLRRERAVKTLESGPPSA